jgi:hypothetical protein
VHVVALGGDRPGVDEGISAAKNNWKKSSKISLQYFARFFSVLWCIRTKSVRCLCLNPENNTFLPTYQFVSPYFPLPLDLFFKVTSLGQFSAGDERRKSGHGNRKAGRADDLDTWVVNNDFIMGLVYYPEKHGSREKGCVHLRHDRAL